MVRIELHVELNYEIDEHGADFVFSIHAAHTPNQTVSDESLVLSQPLVVQMHTDSVTGNRYMRLRAAHVPARCAAGADCGPAPALGQPDFRGYVEACLGDRWYVFDPSGTAIPMGFVRLGTGRDAADVAVATIFGGVKSKAPLIRAAAVEDGSRGIVLPHHCGQALSTDGGVEPVAGA